MKVAQPLVAMAGEAEIRFVAAPEVAVDDERLIPMLSAAVVTVLPAVSLTHAVIVDVATPLFGMSDGLEVAARWSAVPKPVNETVVAVWVRPVEVAVAVQVSALESMISKSTLPAPFVVPVIVAAGVTAVLLVASTLAAHTVRELKVRASVTEVPEAKTGFPEASWT